MKMKIGKFEIVGWETWETPKEEKENKERNQEAVVGIFVNGREKPTAILHIDKEGKVSVMEEV